MKMFKKIMAVALVGVMALSMLTGCAVTNAIIEDKAETALENAWRTHDNTDVNFKSVNFTGEKAYKDAKESVNKGNTKVKEGVAQVRLMGTTLSSSLLSPRALRRWTAGRTWLIRFWLQLAGRMASI